MSRSVALTPEELRQVRSVLGAHLPDGVRVGVFGSRAGGAAKPWSDLDLALEGTEPLPLAVLAALAEAFDDSPLRFKVDLVDRRVVSPSFGQVLESTMIDLSQVDAAAS